jgi:hypothetical protein
MDFDIRRLFGQTVRNLIDRHLSGFLANLD